MKDSAISVLVIIVCIMILSSYEPIAIISIQWCAFTVSVISIIRYANFRIDEIVDEIPFLIVGSALSLCITTSKRLRARYENKMALADLRKDDLS